ncbi:tRNA (guanosine(37)-N1)-methyltransferase TrmD [Lachnospiraceae bacterium C1.1]|nr:tRNA (guanosine(37)-N1)-methyltransferase TrmD [Lachnospiraceae bacterium C1.1]
MHFQVISLFPEMIESAMNTSIIGRAVKNGVISINTVDLKQFSCNSYGSVDDYTYGGGAGMLMQCEPVYNAYLAAMEKLSNKEKKPRVVFTTPQGRVFDEKIAADLAEADDLIFLCGHYEGIDERVLEEIVTDNLSIGDYVLTGGELPSLVMMDAVSRLVPGVLNNKESAETESFNNGLLEYPQYTRPKEWHGKTVPEILLSGDHKKIELYRVRESMKRTAERRPDLYAEWLKNRGIF